MRSLLGENVAGGDARPTTRLFQARPHNKLDISPHNKINSHKRPPHALV